MISMPAIGGIPHLHHEVSTPRGDTLAIRRPRHCIDTTNMPAIGEDMPAIGGIPCLRRAIIASRGDALAIGRPRLRNHMISMPAIGEDMPAIGCIPYLHCTIIASRGDALAIGRPGYCIDTGEMSMISIESFAMGGSSGRLGCGDGVALECGGSVGRRATRSDERRDT